MKNKILYTVICFNSFISCNIKNSEPFNAQLMSYCYSIQHEFVNIPDSTKEILKKAGNYIINQLNSSREANISFVCQHNSRKSHLGQIWTQMACLYYGIDQVKSYSGGTQPTYVNPRIIKAFKNAGFRISKSDSTNNSPVYYLNYGNPSVDFEIFSKRYDHPMNPDTNYISISLCIDPDECCPISYGAAEQLVVPYDDLQEYDNTPFESEKYDEQCREIARDMFYMIDFIYQRTSQ